MLTQAAVVLKMRYYCCDSNKVFQNSESKHYISDKYRHFCIDVRYIAIYFL